MNKLLNVSIIQMPLGDSASNLKYISESVDSLMQSFVKPELIVGVEFGIGEAPDSIPGKTTDYLSAIAKKHGIYFIPGTMFEVSGEDGKYYNSCPVFGPNGDLITSYRKKVPFWPLENAVPTQSVIPSDDDNYCIFTIPEKDITVGVLICYDQFFPEIPRTLALKGAELLICPSADPPEFRHIPDIIPRARALENELYYIWTNHVGAGGCGHSTIVDPEGQVVFQCGDTPELITQTIDIGKVHLKQCCGVGQQLISLKYFDVKSPYANHVGEAPIYTNLPELSYTPDDYARRLTEFGMQTFTGSRKESC